jgi:hypothetical protein
MTLIVDLLSLMAAALAAVLVWRARRLWPAWTASTWLLALSLLLIVRRVAIVLIRQDGSPVVVWLSQTGVPVAVSALVLLAARDTLTAARRRREEHDTQQMIESAHRLAQR